MKSSIVDEILLEFNRLAQAAGFSDWNTMMEKARADPQFVALLVSQLPNEDLGALIGGTFLTGLRQALALGEVSVQPSQIESTSELDQMPAEAQLREILGRASRSEQRQLLAQFKAGWTHLSNVKKGIQEIAQQQLPTAPAGRPPISEAIRREIEQQVTALHNGPPPLPKGEAVHKVATERGISDREVWRIVSEQSAKLRDPS